MLQVKNPGIINDWKSPFQELKEISFFFFFFIVLKENNFPKTPGSPEKIWVEEFMKMDI